MTGPGTSDQLERASRAWPKEAQRLGDSFVGVKHLLLGMLAVEGAAGAEILRQLGCDLGALKTSLEEVPDERPAGTDPDRIPLTKAASRVLGQSQQEAASLGSDEIGTEHMLLGVLAGRWGRLEPPRAMLDLLSAEYGVTYRKVRKEVEERNASAA